MNMHASCRPVFLTALLAVLSGPLTAKEKAAQAPPPPSPAEVEAAVRLQVFLDRAEFGPGKIDGRYGEFTLKALRLYREAHGGAAAESPAPESAGKKGKSTAKPQAAPDVGGLDLGSVNPVFIEYAVTEADVQAVGEMPEAIPEQAKLKALPYHDAVEAVAEKFHCDEKFFRELNPGKETLKAGDQVRVPNVEPFDLGAVKDMKFGAEKAAAEEEQKKAAAPDAKKEEQADAAAVVTLAKVDIKTNMLSLYAGEKRVAAFPVTVGSKQTESPVGDWKVKGFEKMPQFRYDTAMLKHGERSSHFHMLPPGPNNPVGVMWIALNKKGIGLHGTNDPDGIGRNASHGCVRLANWDVVRVAEKLKAGVPVEIH